MDIILGDSLGGGWGEAVSNDIYRLFGVRYQTNDPVVFLGVVGVIASVGFIGGLMGGFFVSVVAKFYALVQAKALLQENEKAEVKSQDPSV